tara:strand:- start:243 stop:578 length:336 start_codon:yes stop_codon:yes gene_type:complete
MKRVKLYDIAYARSGDKGASSNVGLIFINNKFYNWAVINLTEEVVSDYFKDIAKGGVKRYLLPNLNAVNYILFDSLDGGGSESLINDAQGKTHGQAILKMEVEVPNECFNE